MNDLSVSLVARLPQRPPSQRWLVDHLWADEGVGIVGGEPKCCKSFLALDLAVAVASGTPCLRRFAVPHKGPVLIFPAEDAHHVVQDRIRGLCQMARADFDSLDIHVITTPTLRLDQADDRAALRNTVDRLKPRLLILDPFVRLHRIDENLAGEVAPILAYLRDLQREHNVAVAVVHHARKGAAHARAGQALRGSSEFHAWGDSNLYMRRNGDTLTLSVEHRAAPAPAPIRLELHSSAGATALRPADPASTDAATTPPPSADERVLAALGRSNEPLPLRTLRDAAHLRTATLLASLKQLTATGRVQRDSAGYRLTR